jgi:uncharacterized protein (TIGR02118 family)
MIKVTVMYPAGEGSTFDMEYYKSKHMGEIVSRVLKPARIEIDQGVEGQPYMAMGHLLYDSQEAMQAGMGGPDAGEAMADIPNFTNVQPQIQISQTVD